MSTDPAEIVIVGAGHSGGRLAHRLRTRGYRGKLTLIGEDVHPPYERPPLSKSLLAGRTTARSAMICDPAWYATNDVSLLTEGRVVSIDQVARRLQLAESRELAYGKLVLALGARPRVLSVPGWDLPGVLVLRTIDDAERLRERLLPGQRVAIVGAGLIGLELASTAREMGCTPFLVEASDRPLGRVVPREVAAQFAALLEAHDVRCHYRSVVTKIVASDSRLAVELADGQRALCDVVIVAIGVTPNSELAEQAGLAVANGIVTDELNRTSDLNIFAIGDVACVKPKGPGTGTRLETWHNAETQADRLASLLVAGQVEAPAQAPWFWTDQFGLQIQFAGVTDGVDEVIWRRRGPQAGTVALYLSGGSVVGAAAFSHPHAMRTLRRWLIPGAAPVSRADATSFLASLNS